MSQFCTSCGAPADPGAAHCTACGAALPSSAPTAAVPVVPPPVPVPPSAPAPVPTAAPAPARSNTPLIVAIAVLATLVVVGVVALIVSSRGGSDDDGGGATSSTVTTLPATTTTAPTTTSSTTTSTTSTTVASTTTTAAVTTTTVASGPGDVLGQPAGLLCRDLQARGYSYSAAVDYWWYHGQPNRMDADLNGIPCETVYPRGEVIAYWGSTPSSDYEDVPVGLLCRDLKARGFSYAEAAAYWFATGAPDNMDADGNGIPCETVYPASEVEDYWIG